MREIMTVRAEEWRKKGMWMRASEGKKIGKRVDIIRGKRGDESRL